MNLYAVKAHGDWGGGMAVVIANDAAQAKQVAAMIRDDIWATDYAHPEEVVGLPGIVSGPPRVVTHFETGE